MMSSVRSLRMMWISCIVASTLIAVTSSAGNEYLPPSKGYNYDPPSIPFPTNTNGHKHPTPGPYRPTVTPPRPTYVPPPPPPGPGPVPSPGPGPGPTPGHHDHGYDHSHDHSHDHGYDHSHDHSHDHGHDHGDHHHHEPGMPFDFSYSVAEDGNDYSHNAISDGDITRGEYRVALPDGRTQIVKYTADWKNGFNAEVTYEGEARYPDQTTGYGSGASSGQAYAPPSEGGGYQY